MDYLTNLSIFFAIIDHRESVFRLAGKQVLPRLIDCLHVRRTLQAIVRANGDKY